MEGHTKLSTLGFKKKNINWRQHHHVYVDKWVELPPRDPDEEEWNAEDFGRYRWWYDIYGVASRPIRTYQTGDRLPPITSEIKIPDVRYIPHTPHR
jgi:hypothetical protein